MSATVQGVTRMVVTEAPDQGRYSRWFLDAKGHKWQNTWPRSEQSLSLMDAISQDCVVCGEKVESTKECHWSSRTPWPGSVVEQQFLAHERCVIAQG